MLYIPGTQVIYTFAVPDASGDNITGATGEDVTVSLIFSGTV